MLSEQISTEVTHCSSALLCTGFIQQWPRAWTGAFAADWKGIGDESVSLLVWVCGSQAQKGGLLVRSWGWAGASAEGVQKSGSLVHKCGARDWETVWGICLQWIWSILLTPTDSHGWWPKRKLSELTLRDRVSRSGVQEGLKVEPLLLCSQKELSWFQHMIRMPSGGV